MGIQDGSTTATLAVVKYTEPESIPKIAIGAISSLRPDLVKKKLVSDELFQAYRSL